jgi:hypothetical protein
MDSWEKLFEQAEKSGFKVERPEEKTPLQKIEDIGKAMRIRARLEKDKVGIPRYSKAQVKKIWNDLDKSLEEYKLSKEKNENITKR